ncbi:MAG: autotransporter-associated beta strand repeat-containing protein [Planctomycetales bacterium]|nr:autotransporter-associated beta strand repeat-containing protein [Planctomycetales bacterium]
MNATRVALHCLAAAVALAAPCHGQDAKRGIAGGSIDNANALNSRWYYQWGSTPNAAIDEFNGEYVPMIWSSNTSNVIPKVNQILGYQNDLNVQYVLGFNEPERSSQANMTVAQAIDVWDVMTDGFAGSGLKLVSPAGSGNEGKVWLEEFMSIVDARNSDGDPDNDLQVDEIAFHWYGNVSTTNPVQSANSFLSTVDQYWNQYQKPIWITEFAGLDFGDDDVTSPDLIAANAAFLNVVIPGLESRSYVNRYSWWQYGQSDNGEQDDSRLVEEIGGLWRPTVIGDQYIPSYLAGEAFDVAGASHGEDTIYLRGGEIRNTGAAVDNAVTYVYAIEGESELTGSANWGVGGGWVEIDAGASLQKLSSNTVTMRGTSVNNRGLLQVSAGVLNLSGGGVLAGSGATRVDGGAVLALGDAPDRSGASFTQSLELYGGTIDAKQTIDGTHVISGISTLHATSKFGGDGSLVVSGAIVAPGGGGGGGIEKIDAGTLIISSAANTYQGDTVVRQGKLQVTGSGALSPASNIVVDNDGVLDVAAHAMGYTIAGRSLTLRGQVLGSLVAAANSQVTVLNSAATISGNLQLVNSTATVGGVGFNETALAAPIVSAGLDLNFDAALDLGGDAVWIDAQSGQSLSFAGAAATVSITDAAVPQLSAAYDVAAAGGAGGLNNYFELNGPRSVQDATFEAWFYVDSTGAGGDQVIFEAGGAGRGLSLQLNDAMLSFNVNGDGSGPTISVTTAVAPGWRHAVGVVDIEGTNDDLANDSISLYVDNALAGTVDNVLIDDWAGGNTSGIGASADSLGAGGTPIDYHGQIAAVRYYRNVAFDAAQVAQNYDAIVSVSDPLPTAFHVQGDYVQDAGSTLQMDLLSPEDHDMLVVDGNAALAGTLEIGSIAGFAPQFGDAFTVLTAAGGLNGRFDSITTPAIAGGVLVPRYAGNELTLFFAGSEADLDFDGVVGPQDLAIWSSSYGGGDGGDVDLNGTTDGNDFLLWQRQYAASSASQSLLTTPEPVSLALAMCAAASSYVVGFARRRPGARRFRHARCRATEIA